VVKRPLLRVVTLPLELVVRRGAINRKGNKVGPPIHTVGVPIVHIDSRDSSDLRTDPVIEIFRVHGTMDFASLIAHVLHDVDLAAARPRPEDAPTGHHPMRWPRAPRRASVEPRTNMELAILPICPRFQLCRRILLAAVVLANSLDLQGSVAHPRVLRPIRIELELVVPVATPFVHCRPF